MKKVFLAIVVMVAFAACAPKTTDTSDVTTTDTIAVDTVVVDSVDVDTVAVQ